MVYILVNQRKTEDREDLLNLISQLLKKEINIEELNNNPDIHVLNPEDKNSIGIEETKDLQNQMIFKPFQEEIQLGIILDAEKLTTEAQNSLLKSLEDSSKYSVYILHVNNEKNLLPTVRSRAKIIYAEKKAIDITDGNTIDRDILNKNILEKFQIAESYAETKQTSQELLNGIEEILRYSLEIEIKNGNIDSSNKVLEYLQIIDDARKKISANCNRKLTLESMFIQLEV
ncbi:hypothetical protein J6Z48_03480 [bacterium]|nr:hypothetical protein [bacterium]